jgi:hypothetical protein
MTMTQDTGKSWLPPTSPNSNIKVNVTAMRINDSLIIKGRRENKPYHFTIDVRDSVTTAKPDITTRLPKSKQSWKFSADCIQVDKLDLGGANSGQSAPGPLGYTVPTLAIALAPRLLIPPLPRLQICHLTFS